MPGGKGPSSGGRGLNLTARLSVEEAIKSAQRFKNSMKDIVTVAEALKKASATQTNSKAFDVKPLSEYQAGLLKIKQDALDFTKAEAARKKAERDASLSTQAALKEETRIRKEQIALQKQANAEASKRKPTQFSNSQAEIDAYKKASQGSIVYTSAINAERVARAQANTEAAKTAILNGNLSTATVYNTQSTQQQTTVTNQNVLSKKQQNQMLAEEKLRQADATKELKNNAREMLNAKGSLEQRKAALERLLAVYGRMSVAERESAAGQRLAGIVAGVRDQIKSIEDQTKNSSGGISGFFKSIGSSILGTLGPLALLTAAWAAAKAAFSHNVEISDNFVDVQRTAKLSADEVDRLGEQLKKINTRTNLEGLLDIGFEGGRLGVQKDELVDFITTVDKLAVVLKKELPGGAEAVAESLGKIVKIYKIAENEGLSLGDAMNKVGSSQLELAHSGGVTVKYLQDFTLGVAGTAVSSKLSLPVIEAYGAVMSNAGTIASSASISLTRLVNDLSVKRGKYFAIAQLADSTLTVEKFNKLINTDTQAALSLFFKGLKAGNPTQIEFAERIKSVGITTGKVSNAVKVLANNYDLLQGKLAIGTKGYDEATSVSHNFELANNSLAASFDKIKNGIVNYFTSAENGRALAGLLNTFTDTRIESEKLSQEYVESKKQLDELETALNPLVSKYDDLQKKVKEVGGVSKLTKTDQDELREVTMLIGSILPGVTTKFDEFGNSIAISRDRIRELTKAQKDLLIAQNRKGIDQANEDFNESQRKAAAQIKIVQDLTSRLGQKGVRKDITGKVIQENSDYAKVLVGQSYEAAKALVALGGTLNANQKKVVEYYEGIDKAKKKPKVKQEATGDGTIADESLNERTTEVIKAEIKALQDADKKLAVTSDDFKANIIKIKELRNELRIALGGKDTEGIKAENVANTIIKSRNTLQKEIDKMIAGSNRKQMAADDAEVSSISEKYETLRQKAKDYYDELNKKIPKNKQIGFGLTLSGINDAEINEKQASINKGINERFKAQLEEQNAQFEAVEDYRLKYGADKAKERFTKELNISEETYQKQFASAEVYAQKLEDIQTAVLDKYGDPTGYTDSQKQELAIATDNLIAFNDKRKAINEGSYAEAYEAAATLQDRLSALDIGYATKKKAIYDKEAENGPAKSLKMYKLLDEVYKSDADALIDSENEKSKVFKRLAQDALILTRSQIMEQISGLENAMKDIKIPNDLKDKIRANIGDLKLRLNIGVDQVNLDTLRARRVDVLTAIDMESKKATPSVTGLKDELEKLNNEIKGLDPKNTGKAGGLKGFLNGLKDNKALLGAATGLNLASEAAMTLSEGLGGVDSEAGYTLDTIGKLAGAAGDLAGSIASGDPAKIIGSAIKAVGTLFSIAKKVKEMNAAARKEVADYYTNAIAGEREYQDLLKERQLESVRNNKIALQGIRDELKLRTEQAAAYKKESDEIMAKLQGQQYVSSESYTHGTWFKKAKVNKTYESLQGKDFAQLSSLLSQGKLEGDTKALVERLKELEQKGYDAQKAISDLAQETSELFTGTTSSNLTNTLAEMFASGKTSAQDLVDFFKTSMDDAALSIFKNKVLAGQMEKFYAEFDKAAQSGDELTADEIARLNGLFTSLTGDALKKFEEFQKITGSDLKGSANTATQTGISGKIVGEAFTEGTANKVLGIQIAQHDILKAQGKTLGDLYQTTIKQFNATIEIAANTLRTANNTEGLGDKLDQVIANTKATTATSIEQKLRDAAVK